MNNGGDESHPGDFENYMEAMQYKNLLVEQGFGDASIAAFFDKQKITVEDAIVFQNTFSWVDEESMNEDIEDNYNPKITKQQEWCDDLKLANGILLGFVIFFGLVQVITSSMYLNKYL